MALTFCLFELYFTNRKLFKVPVECRSSTSNVTVALIQEYTSSHWLWSLFQMVEDFAPCVICWGRLRLFDSRGGSGLSAFNRQRKQQGPEFARVRAKSTNL